MCGVLLFQNFVYSLGHDSLDLSPRPRTSQILTSLNELGWGTSESSQSPTRSLVPMCSSAARGRMAVSILRHCTPKRIMNLADQFEAVTPKKGLKWYSCPGTARGRITHKLCAAVFNCGNAEEKRK